MQARSKKRIEIELSSHSPHEWNVGGNAERIRGTIALPPKAHVPESRRNKPGPIGRSSDLQADRHEPMFLLAAASQPCEGQCLKCGFRSCLPLRGSSGF